MNIDQFTRVFRYKMSHNRGKRLSEIKNYFSSKFNLILQCSDTDQCLAEIINFATEHPDEEQRVFGDVHNILFDRYSLGNPFIIFDAEIRNGYDINQVYEVLNQFFSRTISRDMFDISKESGEIDRVGLKIIIKCRYKEYEKDIANGERSEEVVFSGQVRIIFNLARNKILINTGYHKLANGLVKAINDGCFRTMSISEINVLRRVQMMPNIAAVDRFHPLTLLAIKLMLEDLNRNQYVVNDILSVNFNNEDAPRVKNAKMSGNSLLSDQAVVQPIYRGDKITHFLLTVARMSGAIVVDLIVEVLIDFRKGLKIQFGESAVGTRPIEQAALELEAIITSVISEPDTARLAADLIQRNLPQIVVGGGQLIRDILIDLREGLISVAQTDKEQIEEYINRRYGL